MTEEPPIPARLYAAATAIANATHASLGIAASEHALDLVPDDLRERMISVAQAALDAADATEESFTLQARGPGKLPETRIALARFCALNLEAQATVLLDIERNGTVWTTTWARDAGTPSRAIADWAQGLKAHALSTVPFRTVFGMGRDGVPTPLSPEERASLGEAGRAYTDRYSAEPAK